MGLKNARMAASDHLFSDIPGPQVELGNTAAVAVLPDSADQHVLANHKPLQIITCRLSAFWIGLRTGKRGRINASDADDFAVCRPAGSAVATALNPHR